jgi:hypothetical protein
MSNGQMSDGQMLIGKLTLRQRPASQISVS